MVSNITINQQNCPVNVERKLCFSWQTDFEMVGFNIKISGKNHHFESGFVNSNICSFAFFEKLMPLCDYSCEMEILKENGEKERAKTTFRSSLINGFPKECKWIGGGSICSENQNTRGNREVVLHKTFDVQKIEKTYIHLAGLGFFVLYINDKKVSDDVLSCDFTNYNKSVLYASYDVTNYLKIGKNTIKISLGDGFFNQTAQDEWDFYKAKWRDNVKCICYLEGGSELFSDESWLYTFGNVVANEIRLGEQVDFTFKDEDLKPVIVMKNPSGSLKSMENLPVKEVETIEYKSVKTNEKGLIFDFERSITGWVKLTNLSFNGTIKIRYGDRLNQNGCIDNSSNGQYVKGGEYQTDILKNNGKSICYHPKYVYHAFRYIEVEGLDFIPSKEQLTAVFIRSSFDKIGSFSCSNSRLNEIFNLSLSSLECNFTGFPTDCPHREKNGWTGDMQLSCSAYLKNFALEGNLLKWLEDIIDCQMESGKIPCIVPTSTWGYNWGNGPAWDYAFFAVPYAMLKEKGDISAIKLVYKNLKKYLEFLSKNEQDDGLIEFGLGDWNYPKNIKIDVCPTKLTDSCYYFAMNGIMSTFCEIMGDRKECEIYKQKALSIKDRIKTHFLFNNGVDLKGMTALSALLYFKIANKEQKDVIFKRLINLIKKENYRSLFGILGNKYLLNVLCENNRQDIFIKMMECNYYPSFGKWIERGATSLWEDFEGTNSRNHHMFSCVASVMQKYIAGIKEIYENGENILIVEPYLKGFEKIECSCRVINGVCLLKGEKKDCNWNFQIDVPHSIKANLRVNNVDYKLQGGKNIVKI